jgi:hypothetical protein
MHLIALCGKKQSGKTTLSNFIHGHEMKRHDVIQNFEINKQGNLVVNYVQFNEQGKEEEGNAVFDLWQQSEEFTNYARKFIWPLIRGYNFADPLKGICMGLFGLSYSQCYGTDSYKNSPTEYKWEKMPGESRFKSGYGTMSARQFLQYVGTEIMRKINPNIWIDNCLDRIKEDNAPIAIISDCRFINEIEAVKKAGGKVVKLTREPPEESDKSSLDKEIASHASELDIDKYDDYDFVINNKNMNISESCDTFLNILVGMGATQQLRTINPRLGTASIK